MKHCPACSLANADDAAYCIRCGFALSAVTADENADASARPGYLAPGTLVDGKYRIERVLGEGGMGVVYLAHDVHTETPIVVKAIRAEFAHDPEFRARTLAEGRALARIDHPNVVRLNAVVVEPATLYLVMQYIDGEPLDALIERHIGAHQRVPIPLALSIFRMILRGVGAAHAEGLIHRDLKPANILVRKKDGVAKVTDFGIAKGEEDAKAGRGMTKGIICSASYMAPEQVRGRRDLDKRVDIYALGIVLFELLIGRTPFEAPSDFEVMRMQAEMPIPSMRVLRPELPAQLDEIVQRACAKERDHRFASIDEFLAVLDAPAPPKTVALTAPAAAGGGSGTMPGDGTMPMTGEPPWAVPGSPHEQPVPAPWATADHARRGPAVTGEGSALPSAPAPAAQRRARTPIALGALAGIIGGAGAIYFALRSDAPTSRAAATATARATDAGANVTLGADVQTRTPTAGALAPDAAAPASGAPAPPRSPTLSALAGHWKSTSNRDYLAVVTDDDTVEFRIQKASQHPRQGYADGEVRFALHSIPGKDDEFAVEDHIRPTPPDGFEYDPATSRDSCIGTWTSVKGRKLTAKIEKGALVVDLVQIRTGQNRFDTEGKRVTSCNDVDSAPAEPIESKLIRAR